MALRILQYSDLENAFDEPTTVGRLAGAVDALRDGSTLVVGTGDALAPGVLSSVADGRHALDLFEAVRPHAATLGNHDVEVGRDALRAVVRESPQPWLCANAFETDDDGEPGARFLANAGVRPWTVVEVGDRRVGLVGVLDPATPEYTAGASDLTVTDPAAAVREAARELRPGVDHLVVLSHVGSEAELAAEVGDRVDAVVGGHAHSELAEVVDGTPAVRPGARGAKLAEVVVAGDDDPTVDLHDTADFPVHEEVAAALRERLADAGLTEVVAAVEEPIPRDRVAIVVAESRAGNLVTDAYRWATGADLAVSGPGGLREGRPLAGDVTAADLRSLSPFDNELQVVEIDGESLLETFRELSFTYRHPDAQRAIFGHLSGARVVWDDETDELLDATVGGDPVEPDRSYRLAAAEYYVVQDGLFSAFGPADVVETAGIQYDALLDYARETGVEPAVEGRIRRPNFDRDETERRA